MTQTLTKNGFLTRFVSCASEGSLLQDLTEPVMRALVGEMLSIFPAKIGFYSGLTIRFEERNNLTRRGIFRGKVSRRKTQQKIKLLKERTPSAPNQ